MAGTRSSPRTIPKDPARSSPRSSRSTPLRNPPSSRLKSSATSTPPKKRGIEKQGGKTSPYFAKTKGVGSRGKTEEDDDDQGVSSSDEALASATGMTESETESGTESDNSEDAFDPSSQEDEEEEVVEEPMESELDSDNLDEDEDRGARGKASKAKRKSVGKTGTGGRGVSAKKAKTETVGKAKSVKNNGHAPIEGYEDEEDDDDDEIELEEGQEIAGRIYPAPKTGQVPPGRISQNTLNFLKNLQIPERNDRDWFRSHEPAYRQAEKEWKAFVGLVQLKIHESDEEVPLLPPKDVIHRIYRDVRFSSDKTPYKKSFSLSTSRGGRKGVWAAYHLSISPNNRSILACGIWQPGKDELQSIRHHLLADPERFRREIAKPDFVKLFGPPRPHPKGQRQNVFGNDDALKVAPKGMDKEHKDIDLLKLRSIAVVHQFTDEEVLREDFQDQIAKVVAVMAPFVHLLNDMISLPADNDEQGED